MNLENCLKEVDPDQVCGLLWLEHSHKCMWHRFTSCLCNIQVPVAHLDYFQGTWSIPYKEKEQGCMCKIFSLYIWTALWTNQASSLSWLASRNISELNDACTTMLNYVEKKKRNRKESWIKTVCKRAFFPFLRSWIVNTVKEINLVMKCCLISKNLIDMPYS